eukprot:gene13098-13225_t
MATMGETVLYATACCGSSPQGDGSFIPLQVHYQERFSAAGRTSGSYLKREGRPRDDDVLVARLVDRPLRPMFEKGWCNETQAVAGVRVGYLPESGGFVLNPTAAQLAASKLDLMMAGTAEAVLMIEGFCDWLTEEQMLQVGKPKRAERLLLPDGLNDVMTQLAADQVETAYRSTGGKDERIRVVSAVQTEVFNTLKQEEPYVTQFPGVNDMTEGIRADGRGAADIRPITSRAAVLPRTHGSALFTRGETQYFFPPSSVGECGRVGPAGRRELGHGELAQRALAPAIPPQSLFPYTVRVESTITESNGSSSMASVCGGCLAMLDAGDYVVLSDIMGSEDALGDMDFKVAGSTRGISAFQMDIKVEGITLGIMKQALEQAAAGRVHILQQMERCSPSPTRALSRWAPKVALITIPQEKIGGLIGPIIASTEASLRAAKELIQIQLDELAPGTILRQRRIESLQLFGLFVEVAPGKSGLVHLSELAEEGAVHEVPPHFKVNDLIDVMFIGTTADGKTRLSHKADLSCSELLMHAWSQHCRQAAVARNAKVVVCNSLIQSDKPASLAQAAHETYEATDAGLIMLLPEGQEQESGSSGRQQQQQATDQFVWRLRIVGPEIVTPPVQYCPSNVAVAAYRLTMPGEYNVEVLLLYTRFSYISSTRLSRGNSGSSSAASNGSLQKVQPDPHAASFTIKVDMVPEDTLACGARADLHYRMGTDLRVDPYMLLFNKLASSIMRSQNIPVVDTYSIANPLSDLLLFKGGLQSLGHVVAMAQAQLVAAVICPAA